MEVYKKPLTALIVINDEDELMAQVKSSVGVYPPRTNPKIVQTRYGKYGEKLVPLPP